MFTYLVERDLLVGPALCIMYGVRERHEAI